MLTKNAIEFKNIDQTGAEVAHENRQRHRQFFVTVSAMNRL
jgi:hypothetical protein